MQQAILRCHGAATSTNHLASGPAHSETSRVVEKSFPAHLGGKDKRTKGPRFARLRSPLAPRKAAPRQRPWPTGEFIDIDQITSVVEGGGRVCRGERVVGGQAIVLRCDMVTLLSTLSLSLPSRLPVGLGGSNGVGK